MLSVVVQVTSPFGVGCVFRVDVGVEFTGAFFGIVVFSGVMVGAGGFCDCAGGFPAGFRAGCSLAWVGASWLLAGWLFWV